MNRMKMSTAQKILKLPKRERDQYIDVVERLYQKYKEGFGTSVLVIGSETEGFEYHDIDFLQPKNLDTITNFLESEKVLQKHTARIGEDYQVS